MTTISLRAVILDHWAACHYTDGYAAAPATKPASAHRRETLAMTA